MGSTDRLAMVAPPWDEVRAVAAHAFEAGIMAVAPPVSRPETQLFRLAMELAVSGAEPETIMELLGLLLLSSGNRSAPTNAGKIFQFSTDPDFERKQEDVVGLYLDPPENSIAFCVDHCDLAMRKPIYASSKSAS